jgi:DNA-binding MurR/RpiR family transcriptional regulator
MEQIIKCNDLENIDRIASLIIESRKIFICGQGISKMIADYFSARMRLLSLDACVTDLTDMISLSVELENVEEDDLFFLITFPTYDRNIIALSRLLNKKEIRFAALTDSLKSPVVEHAELVLQCDSKALVFQNSISAPMFLLEILMDSLSFKIKDQLMTSFERVNEVQRMFLSELSKH